MGDIFTILVSSTLFVWFQRILGLDVPCTWWRGDSLRGCIGCLYTLVLLVSSVENSGNEPIFLAANKFCQKIDYSYSFSFSPHIQVCLQLWIY